MHTTDTRNKLNLTQADEGLDLIYHHCLYVIIALHEVGRPKQIIPMSPGGFNLIFCFTLQITVINVKSFTVPATKVAPFP